MGVALEIVRDPLKLMQRMSREYGDIVRIPVLLQNRILLNHPDCIEQVLVIQQAKFHKSDFTKRAWQRMLGQGLLISEGDFWRRQRRLAQPAFHRARINEYASTMVRLRNAHAAWRGGETRDMAHEMMALTLDIAVRTLFGTTLPGEARSRWESRSTFLMRYSLGRLRSPITDSGNLAHAAKSPRATRIRISRFACVPDSSKSGRPRETPNRHNDLLALLMGAMDEDGTQMTPKQLRDETMTLFLAGHETTAQTLAWTWYMLSENPAAEARLHEELRACWADALPEVADFGALAVSARGGERSAAAVSRRPTSWRALRSSHAQIGGYDFPAGTTFLMSQWVMHRDARYFDDPEVFRPERWLDGLADRLPAGAYFPFGDGPRRCIGQGFAMLELGMVIATVAQRFRFKLVPGHRVVPEPLVTLRAKYGIRMTVHARE